MTKKKALLISVELQGHLEKCETLVSSVQFFEIMTINKITMMYAI